MSFVKFFIKLFEPILLTLLTSLKVKASEDDDNIEGNVQVDGGFDDPA